MLINSSKRKKTGKAKNTHTGDSQLHQISVRFGIIVYKSFDHLCRHITFFVYGWFIRLGRFQQIRTNGTAEGIVMRAW